MIFAILGDFSGQFCTLRATFEAIEAQGVLTIAQTGNLLAGADDPNAVVKLAREYDVHCAQGESDRALLRFAAKRDSLRKKRSEEEFDALAAAHAKCSGATLEFIRGLHKTVTIELEGLRILVCHGAPGRATEVLTPRTPVSRLQRIREAESPDIVCCGGHPESFHRLIDGTLFVGPGEASTGGYVLVNTEEEPFRVEARSS